MRALIVAMSVFVALALVCTYVVGGTTTALEFAVAVAGVVALLTFISFIARLM